MDDLAPFNEELGMDSCTATEPPPSPSPPLQPSCLPAYCLVSPSFLPGAVRFIVGTAAARGARCGRPFVSDTVAFATLSTP